MNWTLFFVVEAAVWAIVAVWLHVARMICLRCLMKPDWVVRYEGNHPSGVLGSHVMYAVCRCGEQAIDSRTV